MTCIRTFFNRQTMRASTQIFLSSTIVLMVLLTAPTIISLV